MSTKNGGLKFITIFIIIISIFYAVKVLWFKDISQTKSEFFEITNVSTSFGKKDLINHGSIIDRMQNNTRSDYDVPYIHINAQVTNLTGDDIENADLIPELNIKFKYGWKIFKLMNSRIPDYGKVWKANETINISQDFLITSESEENKYDNKFMEHRPEKVELNLSVEASNAVGFFANELVYSNSINPWQ